MTSPWKEDMRTKPLSLSDLLTLRRRVTKAGPHWIDRETGVRVIEMAMRSLLARPVDEDDDDDPGPRPGDNTVLGI